MYGLSTEMDPIIEGAPYNQVSLIVYSGKYGTCLPMRRPPRSNFKSYLKFAYKLVTISKMSNKPPKESRESRSSRTVESKSVANSKAESNANTMKVLAKTVGTIQALIDSFRL